MPAWAATGEGARRPTPSLARRMRSRRVLVRDVSMRPALEPGDRLLADVREYGRRSPRTGEIIVFVDPANRRRWLVKRIAAVGGDPIPAPRVAGDDERVPPRHVYVLADDPVRGRDSRTFGPVPLGAIIGPVWFRTAPAARAGPFPS